MSKESNNLIPQIISNTLIIIICVIIYTGFKNSDAPLGQILGAFNVMILFPILHVVAAIIFAVLKQKKAMKVHFIIAGIAVLILILLIGYSYIG